ncbi:MAG: DUF1015 family protein [Marmoricola sp.]|nr:DUF1015 family protein [Marmoricola sp.]
MTGRPEDLAVSGAHSGAFRPLRARLVTQEHAVTHVFPMLDALPASERTSQPHPRSGPSRTVAPDGYAEPVTGVYLYRLRRGDHDHVGLVTDVHLESFLDGRVRGHEEVQSERVSALVELFSAVPRRSELVALLHSYGPAVDAAVAASLDTEPVLRFAGPDDWEQTVWRVPDAEVGPVLDELGSSVHYVADGHHRVAASLRVWEQQGRPADAAVMCVIYPLDGLRLLAFHRRVAGPVDTEGLLQLLSKSFQLTDLVRAEDATGCFAVYLDGRWYDADFEGVREPGAAGLYVAVLDEHVLRPLLGGDTGRLEIASALTSLDELRRACDEDGGALFALRPPSLAQLTEVADRGEVMPPKTTYFDPKPYAGIFLR